MNKKYDMDWVTEWDQQSFLRRKAEDFIDILEFIFVVFQLFAPFILLICAFVLLFWYAIEPDGILSVVFPGETLRFVFPLLLFLAFLGGWSQRRCYA